MKSSKIIKEILNMMRHTADVQSVMAFACEALTKSLHATRCVLWTVVGDTLRVTEEYSEGTYCFKDNALNSQESMSIVLEFLSRFIDESGSGCVYVRDISREQDLHKMSKTLASLLELGDVRSRLLTQLRSQGIFCGFIEIQTCGQSADWSDSNLLAFEEVTAAVSVLVQHNYYAQQVEGGKSDLHVIHVIGSIFSDSQDAKHAWENALTLMASHMGFQRSQLFLKERRDDIMILVPQIDDGKSHSLQLTDSDNPFVSAFLSGRASVLNVEYQWKPKTDPLFDASAAFLIPLKVDGSQLGVIGLWKPFPGPLNICQRQRELGMTIAQLFAMYARNQNEIQN